MSNDDGIAYVDTHCHIHDSEFYNDIDEVDEVLKKANDSGVKQIICVGTDYESSRLASDFCDRNDGCYFSVALHPHEAEKFGIKDLEADMEKLKIIVANSPEKLVAIGECGLDYFYHNDFEVLKKQEKLFRMHIELALASNLPMIFHIRDAFDDFFRIIDEYPAIRGVVHSFSATTLELEGVLERNFYVGLNGIMTFTKDEKQLDAAREVPIDRLLIETDAPFLTPKPFRGRINEPKHVILITKFLSELRGESQALLAKQTTKNAKTLFNI